MTKDSFISSHWISSPPLAEELMHIHNRNTTNNNQKPDNNNKLTGPGAASFVFSASEWVVPAQSSDFSENVHIFKWTKLTIFQT